VSVHLKKDAVAGGKTSLPENKKQKAQTSKRFDVLHSLRKHSCFEEGQIQVMRRI
jgi:hypothetical protein